MACLLSPAEGGRCRRQVKNANVKIKPDALFVKMRELKNYSSSNIYISLMLKKNAEITKPAKRHWLR